jgi:flagellar hook-associated protein 1
MSGLFSTFNTVRRGMAAQQSALQVVSHNVANANTDGYSVQRADLKTTEPFTNPAGAGQIGTGVNVQSITRSRDEFLDTQIRKELSTLSRYESREQFLTEIETIFLEPTDSGLADIMGKFWDAWQQLSNTPESATAKKIVAENAATMATAIKHNYDQLENMEINAGHIIKDQVFEVSSIMRQITDLNGQIKAVVIAGQQPNDLLDRRDLLVDQLSKRFNFDVAPGNLGGIEITAKPSNELILKDGIITQGVAYINKVDEATGQVELYIDGDLNKKVTITGADMSKYKSGHIMFYDSTKYTKDTTYPVTETDGAFVKTATFENGSLNGFESISKEINEYKTQLNTLARSLAIAVNTIHSNSTDSSVNTATINGKTVQLNFFNANAEDLTKEAAKYISVNQAIIENPDLINAGQYFDGETNYTAGNGQRAMLIAQLRHTRMELTSFNTREGFVQNIFRDKDGNVVTSAAAASSSSNGTPNLADLVNYKMVSSSAGTTIDAYFKATIAQLGVSNQEARRMVSNQDVLLTQLETRRQSISGVSIDEEMTNMIQFQRAYEANAKMISVIDQLLDVVVNGLVRR